ncbi:MAG: hypothetical protein AB7S92_25015 [Parvibaculaceae bacterium]
MKSIVKASLVAALLGFGATVAAAQPPLSQPADMQIKSGNVLLVDSKTYKHKKYKKYKKHRKWAWNRKYGKRYRHKRHGYVYFYDGWWYPRPYWRDEPGITIHLGL